VARTGTDFEAVYQASLDEGHEGVVLKDMDADVDFNVRSNSWLKWKADPMEADLEVVAIHEGDGRTADTVGSLGLATADGETVGAVGTGFTDADRDRLWDKHLSGELRGQTVQVCFEEVQISGDSAALRFPSFVSLRPEGEPDSLERIARIADVEDEVDW
jgi:DNA ligase-1